MTATEANLNDQLQKGVAVLEGLLSAQTLASDIDTYEQALRSDYVAAQATGMTNFKRGISNSMAQAPAVLGPVLMAMSKTLANKSASSFDQAVDNVYEHYIKNNKHVLSRGATLGTPVADAGNASGTGTLRRLAVDTDDFVIEAAFMEEVKTLECDLSGNMKGGRIHEERFLMRGEHEGVDELDKTGSGLSKTIKAKNSNQSLLKNSTFSRYTIAGSSFPYTLISGDSLTGWAIDDVTHVQLTQSAADIYRSAPGDTTPTAVRLLDDVTLTQVLNTEGIQLDNLVPVDIIVPVKRESSDDGSLVVTLGNTTFTVDVSTITDTEYEAKFATLDKNLWAKNIDKVSAEFSLAYTKGVGTVVLDEVGVIAFDKVGNHFVILHAGQVPFIVGEGFSITDTIASDSKINKWLWRAFNKTLPAVANATQVTASATRTLTFADSGSADTITAAGASPGSFITDGYKPGMLVTIAGTSSNNMTTGPLASVTATVLTFGSDTSLTNEGPVSATATLDATPSLLDPA